MSGDEEFRCRAINDYYASVTDELDLKEGQEYTIMQTSPSGWWYAVNAEGEDGWVPSNYLERLDDNGSAPQQSAPSNVNNQPQKNNQQPVINNNNNVNDDEEDVDNNDSYQPPPQQQQQQQQPKIQQQPIESQQPKVNNNNNNNYGSNNNNNYGSGNNNNYAQAQPQQFNNVADNAPNKPITEWSAPETLQYLKSCIGKKERNDFKLTQACRYLTQLATDNEQCIQILQNGGIDIVFGIMQDTAGDVAIQMSTCAAVVVICANPASKSYPAKTNGIYHISQGIKHNINYQPFVVLAFNAVCNFCHDHPIHRSMSLDTDIVDQIVRGMEHHRNKDEGYRVHQAGCLALRNIAADPKGQASVGPKGVKAITDGMEQYRSMREIVEGSMGVLCNLCALPANGEAFVMGGGIGLLDNLYSDVELGDNVRLASASVLHNLAANPDTALLLSSDEGIDLLVKIIRKAPVDTPLFLNTLKVLAALLFKLPEDNKPAGNKKPEVMKRIIAKGLLATLNEAVKFDNKELQEMATTLMIVIAQTSPKLAQQLADANSPAQLVNMCMAEPTPQALHCSVAIWFHVCDAFQNQNILIESGIIEFLTSYWYKAQTTRDDTIRIGCGVFIKLTSNVRNAAAFAQYKAKVSEFCDWCRNNKPQVADLCNAIESSIKQMDPMANTQMHVKEDYKKQPNQQQQQNYNNYSDDNKQEVQAIKKNSVVDQPIEPQYNDPEVINNSSGTYNQPMSPPVVSGGGKTLSEVQQMNVGNKEAYLSDQEFQKVLGMSKQEFYNLRPWKQKNLKKAKNLF